MKLTNKFAVATLITILSFLSVNIKAQLAGGNYTIDKNSPTSATNFISFNAAYNAIKTSGIAGAVTFNVVAGSGPYNEQLIINGKVPNASAINTITFNGNGNTISFASTNTNERAVVKLKGAKYFIFDSLNVDAFIGTYGIGFHLLNDADSNIISKCTISSSLTNITAGSSAGIAISGADNNAVGLGATLCDANIISDNTISGGYHGITLTADFAGGANGNNIIFNNKIIDFYRYGIYVNGSYETSIEKNKISRPTRTALGAFDGIYFTGQNNNTHIFRNRIFSPFKTTPANTLAFTGINLDNASASVTQDYIIEYNLIYNIASNGSIVGINNIGTANVQITRNTISLDDPASTSTVTTRGYSQSMINAVSVAFGGNIITISRGGTGTKHCIYLVSGTSLPVFIDYNNYYINAAGGNNYIGYYITNQSFLNNWQTAIGQEFSSISVNPFYYTPFLPAADSSNYMPTNGLMDDKGFCFNSGYSGSDNSIATNSYFDITGATNSCNDIGAYEFYPPPCIAANLNGTTLIKVYNKIQITDTTLCENTTINLDINFTVPYGSLQTFQWERVIDTVYTPKAFLPLSTHPDTSFLTNDTSYYYRCKMSCSGTNFYTNWRKITVTPAMPTGNYNINSTYPFPSLIDSNYYPGLAGADFRNYKSAVNAMRYCGIKGAGDVIFNVVPTTGPYVEQVKIDSVAGANFSRQVRFKGNNTTLQFPLGAPYLTTERAVIKLRRADFINFDSIVIDATAATNFGYGVQLINNADSNSVTNCTISANATATNQNFAGIVVNATDAGVIVTGNTLCDGNSFTNNIITGGYYGIALSGSATNLLEANIISKNTISNFYNTGVYVAGTRNTIIDKNTFSRPTRTSVGVGIGVNLTGVISVLTTISNNRFTNFYGGQPTGATGTYGVSINNIDAPTGSENIVYNNIFYNLNGLGFAYGLYNNGSDNVNYYHNSISLDNATTSPTGIGAGFYQTATALGIQFKNNIINITRGGIAAKYCINLNTSATAAGFISNNNVLNIESNVTNGYIGYLTSNRSKLVDWQNANSPKFDYLSYSDNPLFTDITTGNLKPQFYFIDNKAENVGITTDITGVTRSTKTDIGAYEFSPADCPPTLTAGTATASPLTGNCLGLPILLNLANYSPLGSINFQWQDSAAGSNWQNIGAIRFSPQFDTITTTRNFYRCIITCATNGVSTISTVANKDISGAMPAGVYTIDSAIATNYTGIVGQNFQTFTDAITAMQCGIKGNVIFDVKKGTYNEQIIVPVVQGVSANNTITFQGSNGTASNAKIISNGATDTTNYTIKFDSAQYVTLKNIFVENSNTSYSRVIDIANGSSNINIQYCNITTPVTTNTSQTFAAIFSSPTRGRNITIKGNNIIGGSQGIYFTGTSGNAVNVVATYEHLIDSNNISNVYGAGIFTQYTLGLKVSKNHITYNTASAIATAGIYANYCDSGFNLVNNRIDINNTNAAIEGIHIQNTTNTIYGATCLVNGNEVYANNANTGKVNGIYLSSSNYVDVKNNIIAINSADSTGAYGIVGFNNTGYINYYQNTVNITALGTKTAAVQLTQSIFGYYKLTNNIFSNTGGGRAIFQSNSTNFTSDYNMLYTTGNYLAVAATTNYENINKWKAASNQDKNSIVYEPTFISQTDLHPNIADQNSWAMNGRAIQLKNNNTDAYGNYRPDNLIAGVPDLGAYEFTPVVAPPNCIATPASPAPNTTQTFYLGSDTIMKIKWNAMAPSTIVIKRYNGVVPPDINNPARLDSMFFYTKIDVPAGNTYNCDVQLNYLDSWLGSYPSYFDGYRLGLGETDASGKWQVRTNSRVSTDTKILSDFNVNNLDKLTGIMNPYCILPINYPDTSNKGKEFWLAYPANQLAGAETYQLYLSATEAANVTVSIPCLNWVKTYSIATNTVKVSDILPQLARHDSSGKYCDGINIVSDVPIAAYAHCWGATSSGATMLLPTGVWGYDYKMLGYHQNWGGFSFSSYFVVAKNDNTKISITNVVPVSILPQVFDTILNKGEWLQVLAASGNDDLTGSCIKSIANSNGGCYPIAVFSGDTRTLISTPCGGGGDFMIQQNFPSTAWGKKYLTAPTSRSTGAGILQSNLFRIALKDANQSVWINNILVYPNVSSINIAGISNFLVSGMFIPGTTTPAYLEFLADSASYIESNKPMMVAQYLSGACTGDGDPDMIYLSPLEQGVNTASFYRNNVETINVNVLTLIGSTTNAPQIVDGGITTSWTKVSPHPNYPGKSVYIKHWPIAAKSQVSVYADSSFTGITYGLGSVESYGYNIGTMINNLANSIVCGFQNNANNTTCVGKAFQLNTKVNMLPDSISWQLNSIPSIHPNATITLRKPYNPYPNAIVQSNGDSSYTFNLPNNFYIDSAGYYSYTVKFWNQDIEGCGKSVSSQQYIQVLPPFAKTSNVNICSNQLPYTWRGTSYTSTGTYTKTVPNVGFCDSVLTLVLNVTDKPVITNLTYNNPVSIGNSIVLSVTATGTNLVYSWTGPLGFSSTNQNPIIPSSIVGNAGTYYISISNGICVIRDSINVIFNGSSLSISGRIITANKKAITNVKINLSGNAVSTLNVDALGNFSLGSLLNGNYKLKPTKNNDIAKSNGVTSVDVLLTQRHILNTTKLNSAYKLIAADVDGNKAINSVDVLRMKRLILGTDTTFVSTLRGSRLWEFVDSAYIFPDTTNPFPFKDSISFTNLTSNKINQTFIGVKLGDVNYDWNAAVAKGVATKPVEFVYSISNKQLAIGNEVIKIPITTNNFKDIAAMQYTLHFDNTKYEFVNLEGFKNLQGFDYNAAQANTTGNISMLWTDKNAIERTLEDGTELFTLVLRSTVNSRQSTELNLTLTNDITDIAAWDKDFNQNNIVLTKRETTNDKQETRNELFSISPNPTSGDIKINLVSKLNKVVSVELTSVYGKTILRKSVELEKGTNNIALNLKQNGNITSGIYFLKIIGLEGDSVKKIVIR